MASPNQVKTSLVSRPPVVVVMGHIDHGKSTILDYIRKANIVAGEAGGITQHVGAYQVEHTTAEGSKTVITFLDTPGHEAFCSIRERGANAADVAILAVSAEDGVKPQTIDAFKNIQEAKIPYVVAITKIDKPNANIDKAKTSLGEHEIYVEGWGGDIPCVAISALKGTGIPELLDMIMLMADLADLTSDPKTAATGVVIESTLDTRKGVSATLLMKNGTLENGTFVVAGNAFTPVRFIENFKGEKIDSAGASMPVRILGWNTIPACGIQFITVKTKKEAEKITSEFENERKRDIQASAKNIPPIPVASDKIKPGENQGDPSSVVILPIAIKADVIGSLDGVKHELAKITHDKVKIKIVAEGIGDINENDVKLAVGDPHIILVGLNVEPDKKTAALIERSSVPLNVKSFKVIYELSQYIQEALTALVPKEYIEETTGQAKIQAVFSKDKDKQVVGGKVQSGSIESGNEVKIIRRESEIGRGKIRELQQQKKRVDEVREGFEFGMMLDSKIEVAPGDRVEAVRTIEKK